VLVAAQTVRHHVDIAFFGFCLPDGILVIFLAAFSCEGKTVKTH
jgi:hypothetical protein